MPRQNDVKAIAFPLHTTQIFYALDLSLFGALKRTVQYKLSRRKDDQVFAFIQKVFHSLNQSLVWDNVQNAFTMLGFE
jgi:hypothetical protein